MPRSLEWIMFKSVIAFALFTGLVGTTSFAWTQAKTGQPARPAAECCVPGAECCFPGSPCCADDCCPGGDCCFPGSPCCDAATK
jgi:hypothetical protein